MIQLHFLFSYTINEIQRNESSQIELDSLNTSGDFDRNTRQEWCYPVECCDLINFPTASSEHLRKIAFIEIGDSAERKVGFTTL